MHCLIRLFRYSLLSIAVLMAGCSNTKIIGESSSILQLKNDETVLLVDCTGRDFEERKEDNILLIPSYMLEFDVQQCILMDLEHISRDCLNECKQHYQAAFVVFYYQNSFKKGTSYKNVDSENDRRLNGSLVSDTYDSFHMGSVEFAVYDTDRGEFISSFLAKSKIKGVEIGNRNDDGSTYLNPRDPSATISRARRKGIKNLKKRIKSANN